MKPISTKTHGILDYLMGAFLIALPWLFGFADGSAAEYVPVFLGIMMLALAFSTNYEPGVVKVISMRAHLKMDMVSGLVLAASPWMFRFNDTVYLPHLILGVVEIAVASMTTVVAIANDPAALKRQKAI